MTHVCRSWRNVLVSTPSLWVHIDFTTTSKQAKSFLRRSRDQPLDIYTFLVNKDRVEPFLSTTLRNIHRVRRLGIFSTLPHLKGMLTQFTELAPKLEHLNIANDPIMNRRGIELYDGIFGGRLPKLTSLSLHCLRTNLRAFHFPSLTRFDLVMKTHISVQDLALFLEGCPLLEFIQISLSYSSQPPVAPPRERVRLAALKELRFDQTASTSGLLDHLILLKCTELRLTGRFTGKILSQCGDPAARIHPSSIDHISVARGITKATAMPNSCILSGPNGNLRFYSFERIPGETFDAGFFTLFPISILEVRELWVGQSARGSPWDQTTTGVCSAFRVLKKVEDLTIVNCETEPFFAALGAPADVGVLLPGLRRLTIHVGRGDLDPSALVRCAKARKGCFQPLGEVTVVFEEEPGAGFIEEARSLRDLVAQLTYHVGDTPKLDREH